MIWTELVNDEQKQQMKQNNRIVLLCHYDYMQCKQIKSKQMRSNTLETKTLWLFSLSLSYICNNKKSYTEIETTPDSHFHIVDTN